MRIWFTLILSTIWCFLSLSAADAFGVDGHEIVATIAHMFLHPSVLPTICDILDLPLSECHLAPISTWADENKSKMPWSSSMHFINPLDDHPSRSCLFPGPRGWDGDQSINILDAVKNVTSLLQDWVEREASDKVASEALKFLVHFVGDLHQPLHLTGRDRGGTLAKVDFNTRKNTNLHSVWDGSLIDKFMDQVPKNYSKPLPLHPEIEKALKGKAYDPYIRRIMWEGVLGVWKDEVNTWLGCGIPSAPRARGSGLFQTIYSATSRVVQYFVKDGVEINPDGPIVCPHFWAKPIHKLNCDIVWPKELNVASTNSHFFGGRAGEEATLASVQLDTPEYSGAIGKGLVVEKLLAQGGVRLAGILNHVFADASVRRQ